MTWLLHSWQVIALAAVIVVCVWLVQDRVDRTRHEIDRDRQSLLLVCEQGNDDRRDIREFISALPIRGGGDVIKQRAEQKFVQRDCQAQVPPITR